MPATKPGESPQAAVVDAHLAALRACDLEALRVTVSARLAEQLDDPGFSDRLELLGRLVPDEVTVTALTEEGDRASLDVETDRQTGRFELVREAGGWKVAGQSWRGKPEPVPEPEPS
jgi:hypothetical protein